MRKVCMALIDRANWGRTKPVAEAIRAHPDLELSIVCGGSMPLARFKNPAEQILNEGYPVVALYHEIEGSVPVSMARSGGLAQMDFAAAFERTKPDIVYMVGDRYQAVAVAMAAVTLGIPLVHQQGGEISGSLDERYRHAITKLADYHVPATERARENLIRMGERPESILAVGCPSADLAAQIEPSPSDYLLVVFHPDTDCPETAARDMTELLDGVYRTGKPVKLLWPNIDAGSDSVAKAIRTFRDASPRAKTWEYITNVEPEEYLRLLANAACCVGNSSSFVRDAGYFGTPALIVGDRQADRERSSTCVNVSPRLITYALETLPNVRPEPSDLYGKPGISKQIAEALATLEPYGHKRLTFSELEAVA